MVIIRWLMTLGKEFTHPMYCSYLFPCLWVGNDQQSYKYEKKTAQASNWILPSLKACTVLNARNLLLSANDQTNIHHPPHTHRFQSTPRGGDVGLWSIAVRHTYSPYWQFQSHTFPSTFEYLYSTNKPTFLPPIILNCSAINARALVGIARAVQMIRAFVAWSLSYLVPAGFMVQFSSTIRDRWLVGACSHTPPKKPTLNTSFGLVSYVRILHANRRRHHHHYRTHHRP